MRIMRPRFLLLFAITSSWATEYSSVHSFNFASFGLSRTHGTGQRRAFRSRLFAAGMGMGMGSVSQKRGKKRKNKKSTSSTKAFDANASLLRLEKKYDAMCLADAKALRQEDYDGEENLFSEYIVAVRAPASAETRSVSDWVPVAQLCLSRPLAGVHANDDSSEDNIKAVVSLYCRELSHAATLSAPVFRSVPRDQIQYSVEPINSFHKYVYDVVVEGKNDDENNDQVMTKAEARKVLKLDADADDMAIIKRAYRSMSFELHPDRFVGKDLSPEKLKSASEEYARVKLAYEMLCSGIRKSDGSGSWYESLGGRARTDFFGPIPLMSRELAQTWLDQNKIDSAAVGVNAETTTPFLLRNQAA